jgi:hypothetical protein
MEIDRAEAESCRSNSTYFAMCTADWAGRSRDRPQYTPYQDNDGRLPKPLGPPIEARSDRRGRLGHCQPGSQSRLPVLTEEDLTPVPDPSSRDIAITSLRKDRFRRSQSKLVARHVAWSDIGQRWARRDGHRGRAR